MASITSPEQGAQHECRSTLVLPSGRAKVGRKVSFTMGAGCGVECPRCVASESGALSVLILNAIPPKSPAKGLAPQIEPLAVLWEARAGGPLLAVSLHAVSCEARGTRRPPAQRALD